MKRRIGRGDPVLASFQAMSQIGVKYCNKSKEVNQFHLPLSKVTLPPML